MINEIELLQQIALKQEQFIFLVVKQLDSLTKEVEELKQKLDQGGQEQWKKQ